MFPYKIGEYLQHNEYENIIFRITDIDEYEIQITPFNEKAVADVHKLYAMRSFYQTIAQPLDFKMGNVYWMYNNEVTLNYHVLPNFKIIVEFNEDLKKLIKDE